MPSNSINRSASFFGSTWPPSGSVPESWSAGGWTLGNEGFQQQTFLGASIKDFNVQGGFNDNTSTLNVTLVPDEFNVSDKTDLGNGDDVYHSGNGDRFIAPPPGSPVFFKFGKDHATVEQAWKKTYDDIYGWGTVIVSSSGNYYSVDELTSLPSGHFVDIPLSYPSGDKIWINGK